MSVLIHNKEEGVCHHLDKLLTVQMKNQSFPKFSWGLSQSKQLYSPILFSNGLSFRNQ